MYFLVAGKLVDLHHTAPVSDKAKGKRRARNTDSESEESDTSSEEDIIKSRAEEDEGSDSTEAEPVVPGYENSTDHASAHTSEQEDEDDDDDDDDDGLQDNGVQAAAAVQVCRLPSRVLSIDLCLEH